MPFLGLSSVTNAKRTLAVLLLGSALGSGAAAQEGTANVGLQAGGGGVQAQGEIGAQTSAQLSGAEQVKEADKINRRGNQLAERMTRMLDEARRDKDILRANCVNRKLTEVNANVRNVDQRARALKDAVQAGDDSRRNHEYTVLSVLAQKLDMLNQEASQCLGESVYEPGASQVVTTVPNNVIVGTDPATVPVPPPSPPAVTVPPPTSGVD
jgi:hypothetical protein